MNRVFKAPASQNLAYTATIVIILSFCIAMYATPSEGTQETTDEPGRRSAPQKSRKVLGRHQSFVVVRIERPEFLTWFRITLDEEGRLAKAECVRPVVEYAKPFSVKVKPAYAWHDKFLASLEHQLSEFVLNSMPQFGEQLWDALKHESDARRSFAAVNNAIGRLIYPYLRNVRSPTRSGERTHLINVDPVSMNFAGIVIWECMRRRLIGGRSSVSAALNKKGIARTFL
jgi:hypothetical protein